MSTDQLPGPPAHQVPSSGSVTPPSRTIRPVHSTWDAPNTPTRSAEHLTLLEEVTRRVEELTALSTLVGKLAQREAALAASRNPADPGSVRALWERPLTPLRSFLDQPVQLVPGEDPTRLRDTHDRFAQWAATFQENAVGPGGGHLQDDPARLERFLERLTAVEPSPTTLLRTATTLATDRSTDPDALAANAETLRTQLAADAQRQQQLDQALETAQREYGTRIAALRQTANAIRTELAALADDRGSSSAVTKQAREGIADLEQLKLDTFDERMRSLAEWVAKYRTETTFGPAQITSRAQRDFARQLTASEARLAELQRAYDPTALQAAERAALEAQFATLQADVTRQLEAIRTRYQTLVAVRRRKLGSEPDERYFGTVAKSVNDAITALGDAENRLLELQAALGTATADQYAGQRQAVQAAAQATKQLLATSDDFASDTRLEQVLQNVWRQELKPLETAIAAARKREAVATKLMREFTTHSAFSEGMRDHVADLVAELRTAREAAERAIAEAGTAHAGEQGTGQGAVRDAKALAANYLADLRPALEATEAIKDRTAFQALLHDESERARIEAETRQAEARAQAEAQRTQLRSELATAQNQRERTRADLRTALGYVTALEQYAPKASLGLYQTLTEALNAPLALESLPATTLNNLLTSTDVWTALSATIEAITDEPSDLDAALGAITTSLGPTGRLAAALSEVTDFQRLHPLARYRDRIRLARELDDRRQQLQRTLNEAHDLLAAQRTTKQTLTIEEARQFVHQLETDETLLDEARTTLVTVANALGALHDEDADPAAPDVIRRDLAQLEATLGGVVARYPAHTVAATPSADPDAALRHELRTKLQATLREMPKTKAVEGKPVARGQGGQPVANSQSTLTVPPPEETPAKLPPVSPPIEPTPTSTPVTQTSQGATSVPIRKG